MTRLTGTHRFSALLTRLSQAQQGSDKFFCEVGQHWVRRLSNYGAEVGELTECDACVRAREGEGR